MRKQNGSSRCVKSSHAGFTLLELLVAMAIFTIVAGAAFSLFAQNQPIFNQQQNQAALNISMRNAVAQMQVDIVNGGAGYYSGINVPNWPVGVVINNNVVSSAGDCHSGTTYGANCFDSFTVIKADANTPAMNPSVNPATAGGDTNCATPTNTRTSTTLYLIPPSGYSAAQITALSANFNSGDQILLVTNSGAQFTTAVLTAAGTTTTASGTTYIQLTHGATSTTTVSGVTYTGYNSSASNDPTGMTTNVNAMLGEQYCSTDWVLRLTPIKYDVDTTTDSSDPTLRRTVLVQGATPSANGVALANQIIGFKVGATLVSGTTDTNTYNFDSSTYGTGYDYTMVRSVMVSMIGRTTPTPGPAYVYTNSFDGGPYQIEGTSIVVNPRNMSM